MFRRPFHTYIRNPGGIKKQIEKCMRCFNNIMSIYINLLIENRVIIKDIEIRWYI